MRIPLYLAIAQWALLFGLGGLVLVMFRQLGRHLSVARVPAELGPQVGSRAADFAYQPLLPAEAGDPQARAGAETAWFRPGGGRPALLAFVDPTCPSCEELVATLNEADRDGEFSRVAPLLLISEPPAYLKISDPFRATRLPLGRTESDDARQAYRVSATPLLVAVDAEGFVRATGTAARRDQVRAFAGACLLPAPEGPGLPLAGATRDRRDHEAGDMMTAASGEER